MEEMDPARPCVKGRVVEVDICESEVGFVLSIGVVSGQSFVRSNDPKSPMGLQPTKHTPMLRLEISP